MTSTLRHALSFLVLVLCLRPGEAQTPVPAAAQDAFAKEEQELVKRAVSTLLDFANIAKINKVGQRAKQAFDLVLVYEPNNSTARTELGFKKEKNEWIALPPEKRKKWVDKANYEGRFKILEGWYNAAIKLGTLHRVLGLKLKEGNCPERASYHLQKAVYYNPTDREANLALGLKEGPGFFGTDEQITFAKRMKEIELKAVELARKMDYEVAELPLDQMPVELKNLQDNVPEFLKKPDFNIFGARSKHFTVWARGSQELASEAVMWGERGLDFGVYLMGEATAKRLHFVENASRAFAWYGFLFTGREREELLTWNEHIWKKDGSKDRAKDFANNIWQAKEGTAVVMVRLMPKQVHDSMIGYAFFQGMVQGRNEGLGQGIIHAMTWYLKSTSMVRWGARPEGSVTEDALELPEQTNWWLRAIRDMAVSNQDWAINQVPREKLTRFRNECRMKSWSFMTWVVAAYPDKWVDFFLKLPTGKIPLLEEVDAIGLAAFGKPLAEVDAEWREWARGDSGVAFGTGYGPPLLPERPSKEELAVVDRLNAVRAELLAYSWPPPPQGETKVDVTTGTWFGMPPCELDAEASLGCEDHAKFCAKYPDPHLTWPKAHEEDPAKPEFSRRGQLASSGVIISVNALGGVDFARDSIDGWIGTPYHRFPLLEHNIKRFGYAYIFENNYTVGVLDMASLEEPYDPAVAPKFICWPPHGMKGVPRGFSGREQPNPLEDQPPDVQDITKTGYPVSLQLQQEVARGLIDSSIQLFEARKGGKTPPKHFCHKDKEDYRGWVERCKEEVPTWVHTPKVPLNKKMDLRDVLFVLPKAHLEADKHYQVRAMLHLGGGPDPLWFFWEFTTGAQLEGLKLK
ncbi:MAG TPA: CAP domain-containing protein [Planctomycetota bacterium]|nr:CAP domain-containing protein [Planctomycetota bacterium]